MTRLIIKNTPSLVIYGYIYMYNEVSWFLSIIYNLWNDKWLNYIYVRILLYMYISNLRNELWLHNPIKVSTLIGGFFGHKCDKKCSHIIYCMVFVSLNWFYIIYKKLSAPCKYFHCFKLISKSKQRTQNKIMFRLSSLLSAIYIFVYFTVFKFLFYLLNCGQNWKMQYTFKTNIFFYN